MRNFQEISVFSSERLNDEEWETEERKRKGIRRKERNGGLKKERAKTGRSVRVYNWGSIWPLKTLAMCVTSFVNCNWREVIYHRGKGRGRLDAVPHGTMRIDQSDQ
jgi:hypothetical protein